MNGTPKKRGRKAAVDSEEEDEWESGGSDIEFMGKIDKMEAVKERETGRRLASKQIKYDFNSSDEDEEEVLYDNDAVKENDAPQKLISVSSESENESPPPRHETSEDMFDSLVGRKKDTEDKPVQKEAPKRKLISDSDSDAFVPEEQPKKPKATKKKKAETGDGNKKPRQTKKKKKTSDDEDFDVGKEKAKGKKKKSDSDSDVEMDTSPPIKTGRVGGRAKQTKYVFDSDESD